MVPKDEPDQILLQTLNIYDGDNPLRKIYTLTPSALPVINANI